MIGMHIKIQTLRRFSGSQTFIDVWYYIGNADLQKIVDDNSISPAYYGFELVASGLSDPDHDKFDNIYDGCVYNIANISSDVFNTLSPYVPSGAYQIGDYSFHDDLLQEDLNGKQVASGNLDTFSTIAISPAAQAMLDGSDYSSFASALATPIGTAMALDTAAFSPSTAFVASTMTVNGHLLTGSPSLTKTDVGLGNVDNTADTSKAFSASQITSGTKTSSFISDFSTAVDFRISNVVNGAPAALDTLKELADAINDDANFASTVTTSLGTKVDKVLGKGLSTNDYTTAEQSKLSGIAPSATANSSDATLLSRANHTGTQSADTITDGTTNKSYTATEKTKLAGISSSATANDTDANLKARANHTGTQAISTVTGLQAALDSKSTTKVYFGTTPHTDAIMYTSSATVASGVAVFNITDTGLSGGNPLFPNGPNADSLNCFVSDATASYQMSGAWSNSNKTLTVTANKLTTSNILTGILGQAAANGSVVRTTVWGS